MEDNRNPLQKLFAMKGHPARELYTAQDIIVVDSSGKVVAQDDPAGQHVFLEYGETCPLDLARSLGLPGADAQPAEQGEVPA